MSFRLAGLISGEDCADAATDKIATIAISSVAGDESVEKYLQRFLDSRSQDSLHFSCSS